MNRLKLVLLFLALPALGRPAHAEGRGDEVVVVYNTRVPESRDVAEHYARMRQVPAGQVLGFDLPVSEVISREDFHSLLEEPLDRALEEKHMWRHGTLNQASVNSLARSIENRVVESKIRYLLLCYGVPLKITHDPDLREKTTEKIQSILPRNDAAVDNELACLPNLRQNYPRVGPLDNAWYRCTNAASLNPTNGILLVTRLDGPTAAIAHDLVDKALSAETNGLWGRAYFDLRGINDGNYKLGDEWIGGAAQICRACGFETIVDTNEATFPPAFPLSQAAFYAGWYAGDASGPFGRPTVEFMPGAFAYHLHSFSAATIRTTTQHWVGPLLAKGATATMGCVEEPYLYGTPDVSVFLARWVGGFSYGEAAYACQTSLSWQVTVVGDPLYRPFARGLPQEQADLEQRHSPLLPWLYLNLVNLRLLHGEPPVEIIAALDKLPLAKQSPVLMEKLAELCYQQNQPAASVAALQQVLRLGPTPQERVRVMLALIERLTALSRDREAFETCRQFLAQIPDYPDLPLIYRDIIGLANRLGKTGEADKYQRQYNLIEPPVQQPASLGQPATTPPAQVVPPAPRAPQAPQAPRGYP